MEEEIFSFFPNFASKIIPLILEHLNKVKYDSTIPTDTQRISRNES